MSQSNIIRTTLPETLWAWCEREYSTHHVEQVFQDYLDVMTGERRGNAHERQVAAYIMETWNGRN